MAKIADSIVERLSDADKETLDGGAFPSLTSVRSAFYIRHGELFAYEIDSGKAPF